MFTQTWSKYLPVIKILLKRSATGEQILSMNGTDFQRAAGGRKVKFSFNITLRKGRLPSIDNPPPLARDFAEALQGDETTRQLVRVHEYEFTLTNNFQLQIRNTTPPAEADAGNNDEGENENNG